jgi:uncharacterized membrane protein
MFLSLKQQSITAKTLKLIIILLAFILIILGLFFRFYNLDNKIYWLDESFTSLSISGYTRGDVKRQLITGKPLDIPTIKKYQYPNNQVNYRGTIQGLIEDETQHTPGYFLLARLWLKTFGNSIFIVRMFSVITGILCLPLMYLLCIELFEQPSIAWIATALVAVSPFHVLYSQEARPFSLWTLTTLLSCLLLLKAHKKPSIKNWLIYSSSMIISCYIFLFSLLTYLAHFIYLGVSEKFKLNKTTLSFIIASIIIVIGFFPWIAILIKNPPDNYTSFPASSLMAYPKAWIRNLSLPFIDFNINENSSLGALIPYLIYLLLILAFLAYSFFYLATNSNKKAFFFLASLLIIPSLILLLRDFGKGGQMTLRANYLIPSLLSIQMIIAYTLGHNIFNSKQKKQVFWLSLTGIIFAVAVASSTLMISSNVWWIKDRENIHHKLAQIINQSAKPLVISDIMTDDEFIRPFSLSYYTQANTQFMLFFEPTESNQSISITIPEGYSDIFLYAPSELLKSKLVKDSGYTLIPLFEQNELYCDCPDAVFFKLKSGK